jgi:hypothetical protein
VRNDAGRPPLSVVVATTEGWPYVRPLVVSLRGQAEAVGAEIVFADGSGRAAPAVDDIGPNTRWLTFAETTVFRLFMDGLRAARGEIVAMTEDHCTVHAGWCAAILSAHAEHPTAAAIGGALENGSSGSLVDWASFFITQGMHLAPLGEREVGATTNEANLSFKHWAVEQLGDSAGMGFMAILELPRLAERGGVLRVDDRMVVDHFQTIGFGPTTAIHYHNGRSIAGFRRAGGMTGEDWLRMAAALVLPVVRTYRAFRIVWAKGRLHGTLLASLPLMLWLDYSQGIGHLVGYARGPGDSPHLLR